MTPTIQLDYREFNRTLDKYKEFHKRRSAPAIVNKKALFIARRAILETKRPEASKIKSGIGQMVFDLVRTKSGRSKRVLKNNSNGAPIGALIVNFIRGKQGLPGLNGEDMKKAIQRLVTKRVGAIAFLASGWIPAVKKLSPLVRGKQGAAANDKDANKISNPKGSVQPAKEIGSKSVAKIINSAVSKFTTTGDPLGKIALPALQKAINYETASMQANIEEEMRKSAKDCGIKVH